mgnify:CR=1 FL=1
MAVITEKNDLYLWGDNTYGQLGNGKKDGWYLEILIKNVV